MFAQKIKELREQKGISQAELARDLDITQSTVGNWESDVRKPPASKLIKIADYFGVSTDYLLNDEKIAPEILMLTRNLTSLPEEDREFLLDNFKNTIDLYLKSKGQS